MNLEPEPQSGGCVAAIISGLALWLCLFGMAMLLKGCWTNAGGTL